LSALEEMLAFHIRIAKLPEPVREYKFSKKRRWRFDFAWPDKMLAVECEGLTWSKKKSRHTTDSGFERDCEKYNAATIGGWKLLRFTSGMIKSGNALNQIEQLLEGDSVIAFDNILKHK